MAKEQKKWGILLFHAVAADDGAIAYAATNDVWFAPIASIVKYTMQRDRFLLTRYIETESQVSFSFNRLAIPPSPLRSFEAAFLPTDELTLVVDIDDAVEVNDVRVNGAARPYELRNIEGNKVLLFNTVVTPSVSTAEVSYGLPQPRLALTSASLDFTAVAGGTAPTPRAVNVLNSGTSGALSWTQSDNASWLVATPAGGTTPGTLTVAVNQTGLGTGTYSGTVTVQAPDAANTPQTVTVTLTVTPAPVPVLSLSSTGLSFTATAGATAPATQTVSLVNSGTTGLLNWTQSDSAAWLFAAPASGSTPGTLTVSVNPTGLGAGTYTGTITIQAPGAANTPQTVNVNLTVYPAGAVRYDFTYPDRAGLVAAGWDFLARTAAGATRNTERTSGAIVSYDQVAHPGVLRTPADVGDLWMNANDTRNSMFRDLPSMWTSVRLKLSFATSVAWQQAGLVVYTDDDNYVQVTKIHTPSGPKIELAREAQGNAVVVKDVSQAATSGLHLRLDRNLELGTLTGYYSLDGAAWTSLGNVLQTVANPRLGIVVGTSPSGFPNADFEWAEVAADTTPRIGLSKTNLNFSTAVGTSPEDQTLGIANGGQGTLIWTAAVGGSGPAWLAISPTSGVGNAVLTASVSAGGLATGVYTRTVTVSAAGAANTPQTVPVSLTVTPPPLPALSLFPTNLSFSMTAGGSAPAARTVSVANGGASNSLTWTQTDNASWLVVTPVSGTTPGTFTVSVDPAGLGAGSYAGAIVVQAPGAANSPQTVNVSLTVNAAGATHYDFTYVGRAEMAAAGWDFLARTATGTTRNTERTSGAVVSYDQTVHPGVLRIPADVGDLWRTANDTRNSVFRDLPSTWSSVRLKLSFATSAAWQQAGLVVYADDDNYVQVTKIHTSAGPRIELARESLGNAVILADVPQPATSGLHLRLDRNLASGTLNGYYSLDGATWTSLGSAVQTVANPRLGIIVGTSPSGFPNADIEWAEVNSDTSPRIELSKTSMDFTAPEGTNLLQQAIGISNGGQGTLAWAAAVGGSGPAWLSVIPTNGMGTGTVTARVSTAGLTTGTYSRTIVVSASGAVNTPQTVNVSLTVNPSGSVHYAFTYADRSGLVAAGWDFLARTTAGATRNTEQTSGAVVSYDQAAHPGVLRIPADVGDLWKNANNTRNSVFRDLPSAWSSIRLKLSFATSVAWQQAGLVVYADDDNYVQVTKIHTSAGPRIELARESLGNAVILADVSQPATSGLRLRLDRNLATGSLTGYYSLDGVTWTSLGSVTQTVANPRLGIIVGTSPAGFPNADFEWVEVQ